MKGFPFFIQLTGITGFLFFTVLNTGCGSGKPYKRNTGAMIENGLIIEKVNALDALDQFEGAVLKAHPGLRKASDSVFVTSYIDSVTKLIKGDITDVLFYKYLLAGTDRLRCSHTWVQNPEDLFDHLDEEDAYIFLPVSLFYSQGRYFINKPGDEDLHMQELLAVDGRAIGDIYNDLRKYYGCDGDSPSTDSIRMCEDFYLKYFLEYNADTFSYGKAASADIKSYSLSLRKSNIFSTQKVEAQTFRSRKFFYNAPFPAQENLDETDYHFKVKDKEGYAVLSIRSFSFYDNESDAFNDFIDNSFELLYLKPSIKKLYIDLRNNSGGVNDLMGKVLSYTLLRNIRSPFYAEARVDNFSHLPFSITADDFGEDELDSLLYSEYDSLAPSRFVMADEYISRYNAEPHAFRGKIVVLTDQMTASAATKLASILRFYNRAVIVGERPEGYSFQSNSLYTVTVSLLNEAFNFTMPVVYHTYLDQKVMNSPGKGFVTPDIFVSPGAADIDQGRDAVMEYALKKL